MQTLQNAKHGKAKAIVQQVSTRWNSVFYMIESVLENIDILREVLSKDKKHEKLILSENEKTTLEILKSILSKFELISNQCCKDNANSLSYVIPALCLLKKEFQNTDNMESFEDVLKTVVGFKCETYIEKYKLLNDKLLLTASLVNPKTKGFRHASPEDLLFFTTESRKEIKKYILELNPSNIIQQNVIPVARKEISLSDESDTDESNISIITSDAIDKEITK